MLVNKAIIHVTKSENIGTAAKCQQTSVSIMPGTKSSVSLIWALSALILADILEPT